MIKLGLGQRQQHALCGANETYGIGYALAQCVCAVWVITNNSPVCGSLRVCRISRRSGILSVICCRFSMEEIEALCTRMAIMVNGRFHCLGSNQHLKAKFGEGYSLIIKLRVQPAGKESSEASLEAQTRALTKYITSTFPGSQLKEQHYGRVYYQIARAPGLTWAQLFGVVERASSTYDIEDYSVSQTTLEQVFINFARMQREPQEIKAESCFGAC